MQNSEASRGPIAEVTVDRLDVRVTPVTPQELLTRISIAVSNNRNLVIAAHNLHSVYVHHSDADFAGFYGASDIVVIDGWPILAALNLSRRAEGKPALGSEYRFGSTDWVLQGCALPEVKKVCVLGASRVSNDGLVSRLQSAKPSLAVLGIPGNPWREEGVYEVIRSIKKFQPDLVLVGMGMPLQERVSTLLRLSEVRGVIATVGGAIDQLSGAQSLAPRWTGRMRVEWLWRLATNPRRLGYRYLIEPIKLGRTLRRKRLEK